jgi:hypothetical protein
MDRRRRRWNEAEGALLRHQARSALFRRRRRWNEAGGTLFVTSRTQRAVPAPTTLE